MKTEPVFPDLDEVVEIHATQLELRLIPGWVVFLETSVPGTRQIGRGIDFGTTATIAS